MSDEEFMSHIIGEICDYAVQNEMEPDETIETISRNFLALLTISTFNEWKPKPQTNADRIRSMTDEELAIWISSITWCEYCPIREHCDEAIQTRFCKEILLKWIKSPVEVDE